VTDDAASTAAELGGGPSPGLVRLWAGWRHAYVAAHTDTPEAFRPDDSGRSLFERILQSGLPDDETFVVWRGRWCFALLNVYPYGSGHLMVLPNRAVGDLDGLTDDEATELWSGVRQAVTAVQTAYRPDGVNVGANLGTAAGAGVPDHLHVHVLPRWTADANFMTALSETRVLPEPLAESWRKLRAAWPGEYGDGDG